MKTMDFECGIFCEERPPEKVKPKKKVVDMPEIIEEGPFKGLKRNRYKAIYADPPWQFKVRSDKGKGRSAEMHYPCMNIQDIKNLPVHELAAKDCVLFMWITDPFLFRGQEIMKAWGFEYKTVGFYWAKTNKDGSFFTGQGYWSRANPEQCLTSLEVEQCQLATTGAPKRQGKDVQRLVVAGRRQHSRKPDEIRERIERLVDGPYLELFARESAPGWDAWGQETGKFDGTSLPALSTKRRKRKMELLG